MATRYRIGHHRKKSSFHIRGVIGVTILVIILVATGVYFLSKEQFKASPPQSKSYEVADPADDTITISEKFFTMKVPKDWKLSRSQLTPTIQYEYVSTKRGADNRTMTIYLDTIPPSFPVSHLLPVTAQGDKLSVGTMSDRCSNFAGPDIKTTRDSNGAQDIAAKWMGVNFICGLSYFDDYIVGTSSSDGINQVKLSGKTTGTHTLFFVFDDQNISPNPNIFFDILRTFTLK